MQMTQAAGHAPRTRAAGDALMAIQGPCIGCPGCRGMCAALLELLTVPDATLRSAR